VEDNILISEMYIYKLKREGYDVHLASDGLQAVQFIFEGTIVPDLIILDIMMPNMNGFEALEKIRSDDRFNETKIVIFSNLNERKDRERCFAL
jgi:two-component system alkaline phosphatase synthesis response regulator PhoP